MIANRFDELEGLFFFFLFVIVVFVVVVIPVKRDYRVTREQHYAKDELCFQCKKYLLDGRGEKWTVYSWGLLNEMLP